MTEVQGETDSRPCGAVIETSSSAGERCVFKVRTYQVVSVINRMMCHTAKPLPILVK